MKITQKDDIINEKCSVKNTGKFMQIKFVPSLSRFQLKKSCVCHTFYSKKLEIEPKTQSVQRLTDLWMNELMDAAIYRNIFAV